MECMIEAKYSTTTKKKSEKIKNHESKRFTFKTESVKTYVQRTKFDVYYNIK